MAIHRFRDVHVHRVSSEEKQIIETVHASLVKDSENTLLQ